MSQQNSTRILQKKSKTKTKVVLAINQSRFMGKPPKTSLAEKPFRNQSQKWEQLEEHPYTRHHGSTIVSVSNEFS